MSLKRIKGNIYKTNGHKCIIVPEIDEENLQEYRYYNQMDYLLILSQKNHPFVSTMYRNYYLIVCKIDGLKLLEEFMDKKEINELNIQHSKYLPEIIKAFYGTNKVINIIQDF